MKATGSSCLVEMRLVYDGNVDHWLKRRGAVKRDPRERRGGAHNTSRGRGTTAERRGTGREKRKNAKRAAEFRAAASSSVTVAARILLDIPRVVRMRSSECRARKPRRMAPRVWVVRKAQGPRGGRSGGRGRRGRRAERGIQRNEREEGRETERQRDGRLYRGKSTHHCRSYAKSRSRYFN